MGSNWQNPFGLFPKLQSWIMCITIPYRKPYTWTFDILISWPARSPSLDKLQVGGVEGHVKLLDSAAPTESSADFDGNSGFNGKFVYNGGFRGSPWLGKSTQIARPWLVMTEWQLSFTSGGWEKVQAIQNDLHWIILSQCFRSSTLSCFIVLCHIIMFLGSMHLLPLML